MQLFLSLGKPWNLSVRPYLIILFSRFPVEFVSLFSFIFVAQQFIRESSFAILIFIVWILIIYLAYLIRSHCNTSQFNNQLNLTIDEIVDLFDQLPNCNLLQNSLFFNSPNSTEWINCFISKFWIKFNLLFSRKYKKFTFTIFKFFKLENFSLGLNPPMIESLSSTLISHNHEDALFLNFNLYWFAKSTSKNNSQFPNSQTNVHQNSNKEHKTAFDCPQALVNLKFFFYSIGSLMSFCFKANCQIRFRFMHWQMKEDTKLRDIQFTLTHPPKLHHLDTTGIIWLLDNLKLVRPIIYIYLNQQFLYPYCTLFKFKSFNDQESRRPQIGCPVALFCIDVIQAENIPLIKYRKSQQTDQKEPILTHESNQSERPNQTASKRSLFNCFKYSLPSVFCNVRIFNQLFTSAQFSESTNPFWNFRSYLPIFSHNQNSIDQLNEYHDQFNKNPEPNPVDLNSSFYHIIKSTSKQEISIKDIKDFISHDLLENLSVNIQLINNQGNLRRTIADFQIIDPSQYFLDPELNGQSMWINSMSNGVIANVDQSIKLNVRFTFLTLNQVLNSVILSNAYLANRLAFPIGSMLVFVDSAIGINVESLKSDFDPNVEYGYQISCQLGNQTLYTPISADKSFIWENELLFCVYSLSLEKMKIKFIARSLHEAKFDQITLATARLDLSTIVFQPTLTLQQYVPIFLKSNPNVRIKMLLTFRIVHFQAKIISNCLRNAKVAEEDALVRDKQVFIEEKMKSSLGVKQVPVKEEKFDDVKIISKLKTEKEEEAMNNQYVERDSMNEEIYQSFNSVKTSNGTSDTHKTLKTGESIHILVSVSMRWPKMNKFVLEILDIKCAKFLAIFQIYSVDVYLNCVFREKEKALQSRRTKNFQLKGPNVVLNQELHFNCISKELSAYHLNISLNEKRQEEFSKIAEVYTSLPPLILASGRIDKQLVLNLTPMYLKTSGLTEMRHSPEYEPDAMEFIKPDNETPDKSPINKTK